MDDFSVKEYEPKKDVRSKSFDIADSLVETIVLMKNIADTRENISAFSKARTLIEASISSLVTALIILEEGDEDEAEPRDS